MDPRLLFTLAMSFAIPIAARSAITSANPTEALRPANVVGEWAIKTPDWKGKLSIRTDGTFHRAMGEGGTWRLTTKDGRQALELDWEKWDTNIVPMISADLFRGKVRRGIIELRRLKSAAPSNPQADEHDAWLKEYPDEELRTRLQGSVWQLKDGKRFTLRGDGTTSGSWHNRKGAWRIVGPSKVQLTINWRQEAPTILTLDSESSVLRWPDTEWGKIARRVDPKRP